MFSKRFILHTTDTSPWPFHCLVQRVQSHSNPTSDYTVPLKHAYIQYKMYTVHCTCYSIQFSLNTTMCTVHFTLLTVTSHCAHLPTLSLNQRIYGTTIQVRILFLLLCFLCMVCWEPGIFGYIVDFWVWFGILGISLIIGVTYMFRYDTV